ncbi:efflux RND transporter periplasmic adaptor subunit [Alkaliphilus pronyensis]|uniref:Efflux RND transporter periplasmic adaptor subunit n=1 Tax=Alkaliphilus pronyensis TaxID=1482732 RepID=A0A6I0F987_9FIRM|nr:efflux RND transporter periplasmic adaptor subunit [Alkaliphilus pronyensis]KAB3534836.1 efflux RND transporter periplasmic adaptor subunit [Alkaliphilus pronyensis]
METKKRTLFILVIFFIAATSLNTGCSHQEKMPKEADITVEVTEAKVGEIKNKVTLSTQLTPYETSMIIPKTPGLKVTKLEAKVGEEVNEGSFLFELDKSYARKEVELTKMNYDYTRKAYLLQKGTLDNQSKLKEEQLQVFLDYSKKANPINAIDSQLSKPAYGENNNSLQGLEIQLQQAKQQYSYALQQLKEFEYYSPIDGTISQVNITENQIPFNTQPAILISNTNSLKAVLQVNNKLLKNIRLGEKVKIISDKIESIGTISLINSIADPRHGLYQVEIVIKNSDKKYSSGSFAYVEILLAQKQEAIIIPKKALLYDEELVYVFINKNGRAEKKYLTLGIDGGEMIEVVKGLTTGDQVIVKGQHYVDENTPIIVRGDGA